MAAFSESAQLEKTEKKLLLASQKLEIVEKMLEDKSRELYLSKEALKKANTALEDQATKLSRLNDELQAANKELEAFSYTVSHDLRAPLRTMDGFSRKLLQNYASTIDDQGKHYLDRIRAGCTRMGQLIQDMLTLSRLSRSELRPTGVDLSKVAETIVQQLKENDPDRNVDFQISPGVKAWGSRELLQIVLENLIGNAWKFTSKRSVAHISFGSENVNEEIIYRIKDDGAGFDMAHYNQLFGVFQRLHRESDFAGTGIGLASSQRIIHRHHGRIWAEGKVDEGATFYFTLQAKENENAESR